MAGTSFFGQAAPPSSPRGAAPTTPGAEDNEAEPSPPPPLQSAGSTKERTEKAPMKKKRTGHTRTHSSSMVENTSTYSVCSSEPTPCHVNLTQNLLSKPHQLAPPKELNFTKEENSKPFQNMVEKNAISRVCKKQEGFQSQLFMMPKKDGGQT